MIMLQIERNDKEIIYLVFNQLSHTKWNQNKYINNDDDQRDDRIIYDTCILTFSLLKINYDIILQRMTIYLHKTI